MDEGIYSASKVTGTSRRKSSLNFRRIPAFYPKVPVT
jgi:hypothetical protein